MKDKVLFHLTASGFYTAFCLASVSVSTQIIVSQKEPELHYFAFLFFISFLYYNVHKILWFGHQRMGDKSNLKYRWPAQNPALLLLCLVVAFAGSMSLLNLCINSFPKLIAITIAFTVALCYNAPLNMMPLRSIKGIKAFAIALVIIITGMIIPSMDDLLFINNNYTCYALYLGAQLIFIASLCIAGDIRDIREDRDDKIKTFPVITGQHFSKIISSLLLICHATVMFLLWQIEALQLNQFELFLVIDLIGIMLISRLKETDHYYYFIMMIDGLILMQAIGLLLIERI